MNPVGLYSMTRREVHRFLKVVNQTVFPPIVSALIYLTIFHFLFSRADAGSGDYLAFLVPGLAMMSMINNAFQNSSSSLFINKFSQHFSYLLTMPLSYVELTTAYVLGGVARGFLTGLGIIVATAFFVPFHLAHAWALLYFFVAATVTFASLGILVALWARQFDHLGIFNTFLLTPLTMLGGVFYSIDVLPSLARTLSAFNPIFHLVDGFRYGTLGTGDSPVWLSALVAGGLALGTFLLVVGLMKRGWRVKE